jgi:hypothetical protein
MKRYTEKKRCPYCNETRTVNARGDGNAYPCKSCSGMLRSEPKYLTELFAKHKESSINLGLPVRQTVLYVLVHLSAMRFKGEDLDALDYPVIPSHCPDLGLRLRIGIGRLTGKSAQAHGNSFSLKNYNVLSLDHIDESKPARGNIRWVSFRANKLKSNATIKEIRLLSKSWRNL